MNIKSATVPFEALAQKITAITDTENSYLVDGYDYYGYNSRIADYDSYSDYGLTTLGRTVGFPAPFIKTLYADNPSLADSVIRNRVEKYFSDDNRPFYAREFNNKIQGIVSDRYAFFDDDEVCGIIEQSPIARLQFQQSDISPERLHLRAIDLDHTFRVEGDNSNLFMLYFIDNSMVGQSAFKIRVGIYRQICSNGMIIPKQEFVLCKAVHRGKKDISAEFNEAVAFLAEKREQIQALVKNTAASQATIEQLQNEFRDAYIQKSLNVSKKEADEVLRLYNRYSIEYGSRSKWAMINAVTEFARDIPNIDRRTLIESKALAVA